MSDEKQYTERDLIRARQEGVVGFLCGVWGWGVTSAKMEASRLFPLPKVTRPRRVDGESLQYEVGKTELYVRLRRNPTDFWERCGSVPLVDVKLVADLLANPTEEVDE